MRVAIDGTPLLGARTGVAHVVEGLLDGLATRPDLDVVAYAVTGRGGLGAVVPNGVEAATSRIPARVVRWLWERSDVPPVEHWTGRVDVVHATNYVAPPTRGRVVVSIYDLTFIRFREMCTADTLRYPHLIRRALARGARVHVTSDFVAAEVADAFGLDRSRIRRVYPGVAAVAGGDAQWGRSLAGSDCYVVALGTIEPRKNLPSLVRAFDAVATTERDAALVVAGPDGWGVETFRDAVERAHARDRIRRIGYVSAEDRAALLAGAAAFAYPSVYEGFGFPPLEAMAAGVPVVATRAGSLPEVLGDAAILVEPDDTDALAGSLARVLRDGSLREALGRRGVERASRYQWPVAVEEMVDLYRSLV